MCVSEKYWPKQYLIKAGLVCDTIMSVEAHRDEDKYVNNVKIPRRIIEASLTKLTNT